MCAIFPPIALITLYRIQTPRSPRHSSMCVCLSARIHMRHARALNSNIISVQLYALADNIMHDIWRQLRCDDCTAAAAVVCCWPNVQTARAFPARGARSPRQIGPAQHQQPCDTAILHTRIHMSRHSLHIWVRACLRLISGIYVIKNGSLTSSLALTHRPSTLLGMIWLASTSPRRRRRRPCTLQHRANCPRAGAGGTGVR